MAQNSALATAGPETVDASQALGLGPDGTQLPVNPDAATAAPAPAAPVQQAQPNAAPLVVRIGANEVPVDQAQAYVDAQLAQLVQERSLNAAAMQMYETFALMPAEHQQRLLDLAESLADGADPAAGRLVVSPIDIPAGEIPPAVKWEDMSDEARYVYATSLSVRQETRKLAGIVTGMQQYLGQIHSDSQDEKTARALRLQGIVTDAVGVADMRANGISDPLKAIPFLKGRAGAVPASPVAPAPPEAPVSGQDNVFNDDDPNLSIEEMAQLMTRGMVPASQVAKS